MYNVRISTYLDSVEVTTYDTPIIGHKKSSDDFIIERDGDFLAVSYSLWDIKTEKNIKNFSLETDALHSYFVSYNRSKNKIYNYARANRWEWFLTFTFNPEIVDSFDYDSISKFMNVFLNKFTAHGNQSNLQYLIVPERHKSGRWHLHGIFSNLNMREWRFVYSGKTTKDGLPIFNIGAFPYGWTTATPVQDSKKVSAYIVKYVTKDIYDRLENKKRYWSTRNLSLGVHEKMILNKAELQMLLDSIGEPQYIKSVETPYNKVTYFQF